MTEFEINEQVAKRLLLDWNVSTDICGGYVVLVGGELFDPCNNPAQAWDIMFQHNICITKEWDDVRSNVEFIESYSAFKILCSTYNNCYIEYEKMTVAEKPFVAAMLLFLEI